MRASGVTRSNLSSPSSRLIELMIDLPWQYVSARSMATGSVVSTMIGTRTLRDQALVELVGVVQFVAVGVLQVDVDDLRAALHLPPRDLARLFVLLGRDQPLELPRADLVRALADDQRPVVVVRFDEVDAGEHRRAAAARRRAAACRRPSPRRRACARTSCRSSRR